MNSAKQTFAREIVFDDVTGIPSIISGEILNPEEEVFSFDESDETIISKKPLLQGLKFLKLHFVTT